MKKIITFGVYDYFHLGHLRLFKQCKEQGDYLIVAVQDEEYIKKFKPDAKIMYTTDERVEMIESLRIVDKVLVYKTASVDFLKKIDFDILALGEDHKGKRFEEINRWCLENNKEVIRLRRTRGICSSGIKNGII